MLQKKKSIFNLYHLAFKDLVQEGSFKSQLCLLKTFLALFNFHVLILFNLFQILVEKISSR